MKHLARGCAGMYRGVVVSHIHPHLFLQHVSAFKVRLCITVGAHGHAGGGGCYSALRVEAAVGGELSPTRPGGYLCSGPMHSGHTTHLWGDQNPAHTL